jgi:hypothetical protein
MYAHGGAIGATFQTREETEACSHERLGHATLHGTCKVEVNLIIGGQRTASGAISILFRPPVIPLTILS